MEVNMNSPLVDRLERYVEVIESQIKKGVKALDTDNKLAQELGLESRTSL